MARFDAARLVVGDPVPVASGVRMHAVYPHLQLAVSATGVLVYVPGGDVAVAGIAWVDRQGHSEFLSIEPRVYGMLDLSDDGRRLAVQVSDNNDYILIYDVERNSSRRLPTSDSAGWPKWSPSGDALAYTSFAAGKPYRIVVQSVDSDRPPTVVAESSGRLTPTTWSADGRLTYYDVQSSRISSVLLPRDGAASPSAPQPMTFPGNRARHYGRRTLARVYGTGRRHSCPTAASRRARPEDRGCRHRAEVVPEVRRAPVSARQPLVQHRGTPGSCLRVEAAAPDPSNTVQRQPWTVMGTFAGRPTDPRGEEKRGAATHQAACGSRGAERPEALAGWIAVRVLGNQHRPDVAGGHLRLKWLSLGVAMVIAGASFSEPPVGIECR